MFIKLLLALTASLAHSDCDPHKQGQPLPFQPLKDRRLELLYTPPGSDPNQGHARWIKQIASCRNYIQMEMFHLNDPNVITALKSAAQKIKSAHPSANGNDLRAGVRVILDHDFYEDPKNQAIVEDLTASGIQVRPSSPAFAITHAKTLNCDGETVFVTAMNMTKNELVTRDFGVVTQVKSVIAEQELVFRSDWANYQNPKGATPITPALDAKGPLLWSPKNSKAKLLALIQSARPGKNIACSTESLTDPDVMNALVNASQCNVDVRFLAPQCDENPCPLLNLPTMLKVNHDAGKIIARVMPGKGSADTPYIHSKMCIVNFDPQTGAGGTAFVGSENASSNSLEHAREEGIVIQNDSANKTIAGFFKSDWDQSLPPDDPSSKNCPPPAKPEDCKERPAPSPESGASSSR